jgi:PAS domain S-box-containing protein
VRAAAVHIVLFEPGGGEPAWAGALGTLGGEARVELARDADACLTVARAPSVDVVVIGPAAAEVAPPLLGSLRGLGLPVVVVLHSGADDQALAWFRHGAADCVALGEQGDANLALSVLEQVRRRRATRDRDAAERRIRSLQLVSESVVQNMNSAVLVVDAKGRVVVCNSTAGQILGQPAEALVGHEARDWFPDDRGCGMIARSLDERVRFKGAESSFTRDGQRVPIGISCAPMVGADDSVEGAVATFQDLTDMHQLRRQVLHNEKMASIGQLAAGVAHEINNPMGFIHANLFQMAEYAQELRQVWQRVEELQKAVDRGDAEDVSRASGRLAELSVEVDVPFVLVDLAKAVRESQEGSERIRHIVADLRDFSHQDTGERAVSDLNQCLDSTANIVWPMMKHVVALERHYEDLPALSCYPMQLKQVFMNLLVNAYQAIEEKVGGSGATGRIELRTRRREGGLEVCVSDTGAGIEGPNLARIFDPFFTTKRVGSGTGLGLSTSYGIVQRHGGTLEVESVPGRGTTFCVWLPLDAGSAD